MEKEIHNNEQVDQVANPSETSAMGGDKIDYDERIHKLGSRRIDSSLIDRVRRLTGRPPHVFLRRGIFFAHRNFSEILDSFERGEKFYLYTGRGPSSDTLHLGHFIPFMFTKYLQDAFKVPVVIHLADEERFLLKDCSLEESISFGRENAKDIIAFGFDISKTFIFSGLDSFGSGFYENVVRYSNLVSYHKAACTFGYSTADSIGKCNLLATQAVPSFPSSFPHLFRGIDKLQCLIPCAIDQDPYFRMTRDVAHQIGYEKPALILSSFLPDLQGKSGKMSASDPKSAIYVTDSAKVIKKKINQHAFSGGQDSIEKHMKYGANVEVDTSIKFLRLFLEDDEELEHICQEYGAGCMLTGEVKQRLTAVLVELLERHHRARAAVTDEMVDAFMAVRPLPNMFR